MQPFMKNVAVEYAAKALPDGELAQALKDLQDGKTTIEAVTALIEGGTVSNAKPVYLHPLELANATSGVYLSAIILNNSPTVLDSWGKIKTAIKNFTSGGYGRLLVTGGFALENSVIIANAIVYRKLQDDFVITGVDSVNGATTTQDVTNFAFTTINDDVNKIN